MLMGIPRQEALLVIGLAFLAGFVYTLTRLFKAKKHGFSIRLQVFLALAATTFLLTSVFGAIVVDRFEARASRFAHQAALDDARIASAITARSMEILNLSLTQGAMSLETTRHLFDFKHWGNGTSIQLVDLSGNVLFDSRDSEFSPANLADRPEVEAALQGKIDKVARLVDSVQVAAAVPILANGRVAGVARVTKSTLNMKDVLSDTAPKVALLGLILAGAAALSGIIIGRSLAAPIESLTRAAQRIAGGERQATLPAPKGKEVKALTTAFEFMRKELEERHAIESLAADISHELKNPVASIQASAEVLVDAINENPEAALKFAERIRESSAKIDALIRDLLSLARLESRGIGDNAARVNLNALVQAAMSSVKEYAEKRKVNLAFSAEESVNVLGNPRWIQRAVENLLLNAAAHSPLHSTVAAQVRKIGESAELLVSDSGGGIDPLIKDKVFERFTTTRQAKGGAGLGLAIVRAVAEAHGGGSEIRSTGKNGTTMAVILPLK